MMAAVLVVARLCEPSSELHIAEHWYRHTALEDLLGLPAGQVNDDRLYRALDRLLLHGARSTASASAGELFALDYDLLLYDVTTLPKGRRRLSIGPTGLQRDHRPIATGQHCPGGDARGMPVGYDYSPAIAPMLPRSGNRRDHGAALWVASRIWVMDRGWPAPRTWSG